MKWENEEVLETIMYWGGIDEYGKPVKKTKQEYPYSYDGFVTWRGGSNKDVTGTMYSDRMWQWDYNKYNKCVKEVVGDHRQMFYGISASQIEKILQLYTENPQLKLILIMEYCNVSNGYPVWRFDYQIPK